MTSQNNFSDPSQTPSNAHPAAEQPSSGSQAAGAKKGLWQKKTTRRTALFGGLGVLGVAGVGGGWAYNRYLAEHTEISDVAAYEAQQASVTTSATASSTELTGVALTENGLTADQGSITLNTIVTGSGSDQITAYSAEIILDDQTLLRSAFANNQFGLNIIDVPSSIASEHNGIWAVNGDYYGFRETGIVVRNGVVYRDSPAREGLAFYKDGTVKVYDETTTSAQTLVDEGVWNTLSFGPSLLNNGEIIDGIDSVEVDTNFGNHSIQGEQPRTAIGVKDKNHLIFLVVDGRSEGYSRGATMPELAQMLKDLGCTTGYNIDGGGSSVMVFNGSLVNNPLGKGEERGTSDILYIAGSVA
ncbi:phosphodiester glycosidase family protein [Rothia terrae]|uniref:phosphodiester glycosidase family protein n=1 Tax=Rothia terrae TaxID=396015 RepID=UPI001444AD44|nr:phosphodiester glycosidase family protein [Rothia terrae]NKZ34419.1 phosphodiester glycosidase family protein [Rothia terrae]